MMRKNFGSTCGTCTTLLWVKEHEPEIFEQIAYFMLPKDYLRYCLTGRIHSEYSDAAGTLLLDVSGKVWSHEICELFDIEQSICPPLVESHGYIGTITPKFAHATGFYHLTKVFAGGAIGSGILSEGKTLCSIGTSGVILSYEEQKNRDFDGKVHYFNHGKEDAFYMMGVTLSAGHSLEWFKHNFAENEDFDELLAGVEQIPIGANGLIFTPYLVGERTPHADSSIRASFIGMESAHTKMDFVRAALEGITLSLNESIHIFRESGKNIDTIISIGGGAKNETWLQMQADIFNAKIIKLSSEQGPGMGVAMLAAYGCGWFETLRQCADVFLETTQSYEPVKESVEKYKELFAIYTKVYTQTTVLNQE